MLTQQPTDGRALDFVPLWRAQLGNAQQRRAEEHQELRAIAAGLGPTPPDPVLRTRAIEKLGRLRAVEDLNMLATLARSDVDAQVRVAALASLGGTGLAMAAPVLRDALMSSDPEERGAAEAGLIRLAHDIGTRAVLDAIRPPVGVGRLVRSAESLLIREQQKRSADPKPCRVRSDPK